MTIAVGIITFGRAAILAETVRLLMLQSRPPDCILICHVRPEDVAALPPSLPGLRLLPSQPGTSRQRNLLIEAAAGHDLLVFFDDDFLPHRDYLAATEALFAARAALTVATGQVVADGARGPGLSVEEGLAWLGRVVPAAEPLATEPTFGAYGCNMTIRLPAVLRSGIRFDEALPLYAWYEDLDFSRRAAGPLGVLRLPAAQGVHLGVKLARTPGLRLGYSQIANPVYLLRRRVLTRRYALDSMLRHLSINLLRAPWPERHVDRRGRLRGNLLALRDMARGRLRPDRILEL